eukprot:4784170-Pleurochrysis_carterae.AAC.11
MPARGAAPSTSARLPRNQPLFRLSSASRTLICRLVMSCSRTTSSGDSSVTPTALLAAPAMRWRHTLGNMYGCTLIVDTGLTRESAVESFGRPRRTFNRAGPGK